MRSKIARIICVTVSRKKVQSFKECGKLERFTLSDSFESADISQPMVNDGADCFDNFRKSRIPKNTNAGSHNSTLATRESLNGSLASPYVFCNEGKHSPVEGSCTKEMLAKDRSMANAMKGKLERNCGMNSLHHATRRSCWRPDKYAVTGGYSSDTRDFVSSLPIPSRESLLSCRTIGPSSDLNNSLPVHPGFGLSDEGMGKMDLLRTVYELKDQLNRMHFSQVPRTTRFPYSAVILGSTLSESAVHHVHHGRSSCSCFNWNYSTWLPTQSCSEMKPEGIKRS